MAILKCKMCGGDIQATDNTFGTCDSCGSTMTLPKASDDQKINLFNRANNLRRQNEFDKAISVYENILNLDATSAEAHWGMVLSKYGIEYVEDPKTGQRVPTCHRVQNESILTDGDYLSALDNANDEYTKSLYKEEAKQISEIQRGILAISSKEEPYDVFICYKETTAGGTRTKDSTIAQDLYYELQEKGYRVFFAKITLEDKLGREYEPYIFSALNSAKVMLVMGTCKEHFEAVWVKNEWSRFLALMKKDKSRLLIPCFRDMDAYDIPDELSHLQSEDMSKVGFVQDILRGLKKVLGAEESDTKKTGPAAPVAGGPTVESLLKRGDLFLADGEWDQAKIYFDKTLDVDPEYAPAYIGLLCAELKVQNKKALFKSGKQILDNKNYQKALRFADGDYKAELEGYIQQIKEFELKKKYDELVALKRNASGYNAYLTLARKFRDMNGYADTAELSIECENAMQQILEAQYNELLRAKEQFMSMDSDQEKPNTERLEQLAGQFKSMNGYKDSEALAKECTNAASEAAKEDQYNKLLLSKEKVVTEAAWQTLAEQLRAMNGYKNSEALAKECENQYEVIKDRREAKAREVQAAEERARQEKAREEEKAIKKEKIKGLILRILKMTLIAAVVFVIGFGGFSYYQRIDAMRLAEIKKIELCSASVKGSVTDYKVTESYDREENKTYRSYYPVFSYTINGIKYTHKSGTSRSNKRFKMGEKVTVYYNPQDTKMFYIAEDTADRHNWKDVIYLEVFFACIGLIFLGIIWYCIWTIFFKD